MLKPIALTLIFNLFYLADNLMFALLTIRPLTRLQSRGVKSVTTMYDAVIYVYYFMLCLELQRCIE